MMIDVQLMLVLRRNSSGAADDCCWHSSFLRLHFNHAQATKGGDNQMKKRNGIMTFRLPDDEKAKLSFLAEASDRSLSDLAVQAIRDLITKLEAEQAPKGKKK